MKFFKTVSMVTGATYGYIAKKAIEHDYNNMDEWCKHGKTPPIRLIPGAGPYTPAYLPEMDNKTASSEISSTPKYR